MIANHQFERILIDKSAVDRLENEILITRHIERYALVRKFAYGRVLDVACGVGYGTYLVAKNPDVKMITGVDLDKNSVEWAINNFNGKNIQFQCNTIENLHEEYDVLISLETIEHLQNPKILGELAKRCKIKEVIISFPHKKTTHYNPYHLWDIEEKDILVIFNEYICINKFYSGDSTFMHLIYWHRNKTPRKKYLETRSN
ncbi:hypothetical protein AN641_09455 [Candidatus Epulonipiscioides gigas]|nr:hypothetical protein AN641_09455 [Epulopiscium sp. SCG-C07WGA-EpuloA2]